MNADNSDEMAAGDLCCASCGKAELDEIKLKECPQCDLVRYCSDACQQEHRDKHEAICKERAAELREEILFRQPESSHLGDCPICFLPLLLDITQFTMTNCCSKVFCDGCVHAYGTSTREQRHKLRCPFCRKRLPKTDEESKAMLMKRAEVNDSLALLQLGFMHKKEGDCDTAIKYCTRAAEWGDAMAHFSLSDLYYTGKGVEKDEERAMHHLEEAAIAGHPEARYNLGVYEFESGRFDRAVKHWIIAANLGHDDSVKQLKECYKEGHISKDDFAGALRAHHAAVDAMTSPQRKAADILKKEHYQCNSRERESN